MHAQAFEFSVTGMKSDMAIIQLLNYGRYCGGGQNRCTGANIGNGLMVYKSIAYFSRFPFVNSLAAISHNIIVKE
jgi:hypothetical protein